MHSHQNGPNQRGQESIGSISSRLTSGWSWSGATSMDIASKAYS